MVGTVMGLARTDLAGGGAVFDSLVGQVSDSSQSSARGATAPPGDVDLEV